MAITVVWNVTQTIILIDNAVLVRFLEQNQGVLSKRAKEKEFSMLTEREVKRIESTYTDIFGS